ncbi:uncharacterized protein RCC_11465 [Ramularia collo-cygni]|uniref:Trihydrophobin n=1 Tax=Ramularia collo-cygni TaxID=112498 RepID=A0A2D3VLQ5_9PEZI|nr:uncharacterized protein RCC_11465 [Ramularia collo-cygni]CZT25796.1 uncharacterized protein RCC_11465 [Ramularia collo-cygni]
MQFTSVFTMLLAGAAFTIAAPGNPTYGGASGGSQGGMSPGGQGGMGGGSGSGGSGSGGPSAGGSGSGGSGMGAGSYQGGMGGSGGSEKSPMGGSGGSGSQMGGSGGSGGSGNQGRSGGQPYFCGKVNGLQGSPQCCQTNVLGVASLTCSPPSSSMFTQQEFSKDCAKNGRVASCCVLPAAGLGVACQDLNGNMLS